MSLNRILIIEDHRDFREAVKRFLELHGVVADVTEASSGEEGVLMARQTKPNLVIMDFYLRGINGRDAARQIKEKDPDCDIIMLTMFEPKEITSLGKCKDFQAIISKGDLSEKLMPAVEKSLRRANNHSRK
jgi:DNA-binding NarL/FixJ family response regulator